MLTILGIVVNFTYGWEGMCEHFDRKKIFSFNFCELNSYFES